MNDTKLNLFHGGGKKVLELNEEGITVYWDAGLWNVTKAVAKYYFYKAIGRVQ